MNHIEMLKRIGAKVIVSMILIAPVIATVLTWLLIDPGTAIEKMLSVFVCGCVGLTTFVVTILAVICLA